MTTDRETAEVLRSWMKEEIQLDDAGVHRVLARLPETPQRRHRWLWPFDWRPFATGATRSAGVHGVRTPGHQPAPLAAATGRFSTTTGRTRPMFSPVKAIIAGALVFALGGALLISQPFGQEDGFAPGAEPAQLSGTRVVVAHDCDREAEPPACTWTSSDPRLTGVFSDEFVGGIVSVGELDGDLDWADATLEGPEGTWTGRLYLNLTDPPVGVVVLSGSGAYEGWQYVATEVGGDGVHDDWSGVIYEGELPPFGPASDAASE